MSEFSFYSTNEVYGETYFQLPKVFFTNKQYTGLSNDAKIAFAILKDRFSYSIKNNWVDEEKHIYFIYTNKELMTILNYSEKKIISIKKELESVNLLFQKRVGLNQPNRLYLGKPQATAQDVYLQENSPQSLGTSGTVKKTVPENSPQSLGTSGTVKKTVPENSPQSLGTSGTVKSTAYLYKELLNKDTYKDTVKDTEKEDLQNRELLQSFSETQDQSFLDKRCLDLIALFSTSIQEAHETVGIIIRAKNKQEKKYARTLVAEDWQEEIEATLRKVYHKIKTDHKIKNQDNYMFGAFCTTFENCILQMNACRSKKDKDLPVISMHNWLDQTENKQ
ncbi:replication initiator protein A [Enterococcus faecalis]|nr:replication initiator protein A [Enterococcus faecalis]EKZ0051978.1 replication initiator protein A [Enterococcus faecalis]EKZ0076714.1 replication initiator protein A [Enterococcus faecalis]HDT7288345.1 replication initiator protein A [Enterococcus faecalis]HEM8452350.1 replication initiator protein A [Enterococcus faecalis]